VGRWPVIASAASEFGGSEKKSGSAPLEHRAAGLLQKYVETAEVVGGNLLQLLFAYFA
jgi:hypothetical protein